MAKRDRTEAGQRLSETVSIAETGEGSADAPDPRKIEIHEGLGDAAAGRVADVDIDRMAACPKGMFRGRVRSPVSCAELDEAIADAEVEDFDSSTDTYVEGCPNSALLFPTAHTVPRK